MYDNVISAFVEVVELDSSPVFDLLADIYLEIDEYVQDMLDIDDRISDKRMEIKTLQQELGNQRISQIHKVSQRRERRKPSSKRRFKSRKRN